MPHYKNTYRTNSEVTPTELASVVSSESGCKNSTRMEKCKTWSLCFTTLLLIGISVVLVLYLSTDILKLNKHSASKCETKECLEIAAELLHSINESIDPCQDFYEFACGKMKKELKSVNLLQNYHASYMLRVQQTLEKPLGRREPKIMKVAKAYYNSCMNMGQTKDNELNNLMDVMKNYGGWPLVVGSNWSSKKNISYEFLMQLNKDFGFSTDHLLKISLRKDFRNTSKNVLYLEPPNYIPSTKNLSEELGPENLEFQTKIASVFGASNSTETKLALKTILGLQANINEMCKKLNSNSDLNTSTNYTLTKMKELKSQIPSINWMNYIKQVTDLKMIGKNLEIIVTYPEYLNFFATVLKDTLQKDLINFFLWKIVMETSTYFPHLFDEIQSLQEQIKGKRRRNHVSRKEICAKATLRDLPYTHNYLMPERSKIQSFYFEPEEVGKYVAAAYNETFKNSKEMDITTRTVALEKILNLKFNIGIAADIVTSFYEPMELPLRNESYFHTYRNISIYKKFQKNLMMRTKDFNEKLFERGETIKAFYAKEDNFVYFPFESVNKLYKKNRPNYIHFSRVGFAAAFLTLQLMDRKGKQIDSKGITKNWWTEKSNEKLDKKISYYFEKKVNATTDLDKNNMKWTLYSIHEGIKQSYIGYQKWTKDSTSEQPLAGLEYNPNQLFWISLAQLMCKDDMSDAFEKTPSWELLDNKQRVNISFQKLEMFSKDWNCCRNNGMYFKDKCC